MVEASGHAPAARRLGRGPTAAYGFGAAAYGVKDQGFGTFLLLFYNQVIGLDPSRVGLVVMAALLVDAFVDPAVGWLSDRTRGRWGRRHPWMYASALPIAVGWIALWNPPALSRAGTLFWLFGVAVLVRSAVSCYEVPAAALVPELTGDYDERTRITAWRYLFGWAGGLAMLLAAYTIFLKPVPGYPNGLLNPGGYPGYALAGAAFMVVAILVSSLGTHRQIPYLPQPVAKRQSLGESFRELRETLGNRAFLVLMLAGMAAYTNQGINYALSNYLYSYVWGIKGATFVAITLALFAGVAIAFWAAPRLGGRGSKARAARIAVLIGIVSMTGPYWLRFAGWMPPAGSGALLPVLLCFFAAGTASNVSAFILGASMMADVVEDSEARTGRRNEGVFFAGSFFVQKCTSGVGIFLAGAILSAAAFPDKAVPGAVPMATLDRLTMIYVGLYTAVALLAAWAFTKFPFGRAEHEARLARLAGAASVDAGVRGVLRGLAV